MALWIGVIFTTVTAAHTTPKNDSRGGELGSTNKNVLLLISDDLRAGLAGAYGHPETHTPRLG